MADRRAALVIKPEDRRIEARQQHAVKKILKPVNICDVARYSPGVTCRSNDFNKGNIIAKNPHPKFAATADARCGSCGHTVSMVSIAIEDTGIGIREKDLDKLFSPFVRLHAHGESVVPGTGLGLYLTNKLLQEILNGDILVTNTYGAGSRFAMVWDV